MLETDVKNLSLREISWKDCAKFYADPAMKEVKV